MGASRWDASLQRGASGHKGLHWNITQKDKYFLKKTNDTQKKQISHKKTKDCVEILESESGQGILKASDHIYHIIA